MSLSTVLGTVGFPAMLSTHTDALLDTPISLSQVIALSYNALGDDTLSMLTSVLSLDSCLCEIYLRGSRMSEKASIELQGALLDNMRLQTLDVRDTDATSTASGWLWDASQDPPLIMQQVSIP
jgi:hypothetical protein